MNEIPLSPSVERLLLMAKCEAHRTQSDYVFAQHLLVAMSQEGKNLGALMMEQKGITIEQLRALDFNETNRQQKKDGSA